MTNCTFWCCTEIIYLAEEFAHQFGFLVPKKDMESFAYCKECHSKFSNKKTAVLKFETKLKENLKKI